MMRCARCKAETELCDTGVPVCPSCSIRERLTQEVLETTANKADAFRKFEAIMLHCPSGLPHPDGVQQIKNAPNELSVAQKEMTRAYDRLSAYLDQGIVPEDLKAPAKKASTLLKSATRGLDAKATPKASSTPIFLKLPKQR